ncbi:hypothetical protein RIF25_09420 [Thermosynechococcaceae cyanobacterium BACA0444]|uniref:Uncharacterized protein n=1 Tax=Pseudocalidococcus azoricus BACA0444 TaxID=2918990 RepID=A0AAE4JZN3_9CYAN|nr:hypothetical protein [Pseudocalidococcus azoricus]MDS3861027.1 hypothetical protein [Pseudocalidococcus azoricus BACA0444]
MNTIRSFGLTLTDTNQGDLSVFYKPGLIPGTASTDRVAALINYLFITVNLPNAPVIQSYSGRSVALTLKPFSSSPVLEINTLDLRPAVVPYTIDLLPFLFGQRNPTLGPDCEIGVKLIDKSYGYLLSNESLTIYGAAGEEIENNQDTIIQKLN